MTAFERIGVVGGGQMGAGIAEVFARAHFDVVVTETSAERAERARQRVHGSLERAVTRGKLEPGDAAEALERVAFSDSFDELADRDLVIEAVVEDGDVKGTVFETLDRVVAPAAVLATNTSSIPIIDLAMATSRADQVLGLHFFNPVPVMRLVEVVPSLKTAPQVIEATTDLLTSVLGKQVITSQDRAGFVVNSLLVPYLLSAIRMLESGFASAVDIDAGMRLGCAHPMGPLELTDLIGLDTTAAIAQSMYEEFKEPSYAPPALLLRMVRGELLGRKSGRGFYEYAG